MEKLASALPFIAIAIALCLAFAVRVTTRRRTGECRAAGDPFFYPIGECPTLPVEAIANYRRHLVADDFRAWGIPHLEQKSFRSRPLLRNESGGRTKPCPRSSAAVLTLIRGGRHV